MIATSASESNLELPQFLPFIAHTILYNIELFSNLLPRLSETIKHISPNLKQIEKNVHSSTAIATLLTPTIGYEAAASIVKESQETGKDVIEIVKDRNFISPSLLKKLLTPQVMASPGLPVADSEEKGES